MPALLVGPILRDLTSGLSFLTFRQVLACPNAPRKGARWKATRVHKMLANPLYAGFICWRGETVMGKHDPIVSRGVFDAVQGTRRDRQHKTRQLRNPNYLAGLVRCGPCGAPTHVTYPGDNAKCQYRYYVCNNRLNHQACGHDYIRAEMLEATILQNMAKLAERADVITALVAEFVARAHKTVAELEQKRAAIVAERGYRGQREAEPLPWGIEDRRRSSEDPDGHDGPVVLDVQPVPVCEEGAGAAREDRKGGKRASIPALTGRSRMKCLCAKAAHARAPQTISIARRRRPSAMKSAQESMAYAVKRAEAVESA